MPSQRAFYSRNSIERKPRFSMSDSSISCGDRINNEESRTTSTVLPTTMDGIRTHRLAQSVFVCVGTRRNISELDHGFGKPGFALRHSCSCQDGIFEGRTSEHIRPNPTQHAAAIQNRWSVLPNDIGPCSIPTATTPLPSLELDSSHPEPLLFLEGAVKSRRIKPPPPLVSSCNSASEATSFLSFPKNQTQNHPPPPNGGFHTL